MANVDAYEVTMSPHYELVEPPMEMSPTLPTVVSPVGTPQIYYIMQANDSVTGARFDWTVPSTPDIAGVGYPGPNAPTNIATAGVRVA